MEEWFVYLILAAAAWLLYMEYRLRRGRSRLKERNAGHDLKAAVSETQSDVPVSEGAVGRFDEDKDVPDWKAAIEEIVACGTPLPEVFSGFQEEQFFNLLESMDMEEKVLLKEMEEKSAYAETFLDRKITGTKKQTYIDSSLYEELAGILPVIASGVSVPAFVNNVLADHLEKHRDVMNEMYRKEVEKRLQEWKK